MEKSSAEKAVLNKSPTALSHGEEQYDKTITGS